MKKKLPNIELFVYFSCWIGANLYCLNKLYKAQSDYYENNYSTLYYLGELQPGWWFIDRLQDVSDVEWSSWKFFIQTAWFYLLLQFSVSEVIRNTHAYLLKHWYIISSVTFIVIFMGYRQLIVILAQPLIFAAIIFTGGGKKCVWAASIAFLFSYNSMKYKYFFWYYLDREDLKDEEVYLVLFTMAWITLRCVSFCVDYIDRKEKIEENKANLTRTELVINMFSYVLYTPLLYIGPLILYEDFEKSFTSKTETLRQRLRMFLLDMFLFTSYTVLLDCAFHYFYFLAMQSDIEAIKKLPTIALCGGGLWMGLEFHLKYVISYGTTAAFARLDNLDPPPIPRCIARVHIYSQMWRYFDVGLYKYLVKYIYKPILQMMSSHSKLRKMVNKLFASFLTFVFIYMWHGTLWNILVWSILNFLGITLENVGKAMSQTYYYKLFKTKFLKTDEMEIRFVAGLCTPVLAVSAISNFYLFAGNDVGNIYFDCFTHPSLFNSILVSVSLYCCCQVSMALQNVPSRTDRKRDIKETTTLVDNSIITKKTD